MKSNIVFNNERIQALYNDPYAYVMKTFQQGQNNQSKPQNSSGRVNTQAVEQVLFPEPYQNATPYYNRRQFAPPPPPEPPTQPPHNNPPMLDIKSLLPMLMSGKMNDVLKPLLNILGGGNGLGDISKVFELFKPKKKKENTEKQEKSKFDDMIIIE